MGECLICSQSKWRPIFGNLLHQCRVCGFITYPIEEGSFDPEKVYTKDYFQGEEYLNYFEDHEVISHNFKKRIQQLEDIFHKDASWSNILEIGCASGVFGNEIKKNFPEAHYTGIDISKDAINEGKNKYNLNLNSGDFLKFKAPYSYEHIFLWDVIEHLVSPDKYLEKVHEESADNAYIVLTTGDISSFFATLRSKKWRMIHPPTHIHYFSKKSITSLLENNGFKVVAIKYPSISRNIKLIWYSLFMLRKKQNKFKSRIFNAIPEKWNLPINTFDIMMVVAKKV